MLRSAAAMPAIERSSGSCAVSSPARWRRSSSTCTAFIGSTYGLRSVDRALQHRLALEQPLDAGRGEHARDGARVLLLDRREERSGRATSER